MKILFLTHRLPYAPNRGDRIRAVHLLREMSQWSEVHLVSLVHDAGEQEQAPTISTAASVTTAMTHAWRSRVGAALSLPSRRPLTHLFLDGPALAAQIGEVVSRVRPDLILAYCSGMARFAMEKVRLGLPFVLDMVDVDSEKWRELSASTRGPLRLIYAREARALGAFEVQACRAARATLVVNERERALLAARVPNAQIHVVPVGIDVEQFHGPLRPHAAQVVVFCAVFDYEPNVLGARWLAKRVWPLVRTRHPAARLVFVGANPVRAVRALAEQDATVQVTGTVPDVRPYLWNAMAAAAPLHVARGVQTKVLEAVAAGLPVVVTPDVAGGLPAELLPACTVAETSEDFAFRLSELLAASATARADVTRRVKLDDLSWKRQLRELRNILETAASVGAADTRP